MQKETPLSVIINELPQNRPLYKDSGSWQIRSDDMEEVLYQQEVAETFASFIWRVYETESMIGAITREVE